MAGRPIAVRRENGYRLATRIAPSPPTHLAMSVFASRRSLLRPARLAGVLLATVVSTLPHLSAQPSTSTAMSSSAEYSHIKVPARIAGLAFSYLKPADFQVVDVPGDIPDFEQPAAFMPLQVVMANYGVVLFTVQARPAYGDGSVEDWAGFLAREQNMEIISLRPATVAGMPGIMVDATQASEMGPMRLRFALIEDGTRMINLAIMAPQALWASVEPTLAFTLSSFRLDEIRGSTHPVTRAEAAEQAAALAAATAAAATPAPENEETPSEDAGSCASSGAAAASLALANDAESLDSSHPFNLRLRDQGAGLTPRLLDASAAEQFALVGAGAVAATFRVPFGWHVIDDGQRTLVFDAEGRIQVSLNLRRDQGDPQALLQRILDENQQQPQIDPVFRDFAGELPGLVLRNYRDGDDVLAQAFIVRTLRDDGLVHVARITSSPDDLSRAVRLAEFILLSLGTEVSVAAR